MQSNINTNKTQKDEMIAYTDGSCLGNPGVGGWGVLLIKNGQEQSFFGGAQNTTNNKMELTAAIEALQNLPDGTHLTLITDSIYVKDGITKWLQKWKRNGWRTSNKSYVKNKDLWCQLEAQSRRHNVTWQWVQGHTGNRGNEKADALARQGMRSYLKPENHLKDETQK